MEQKIQYSDGKFDPGILKIPEEHRGEYMTLNALEAVIKQVKGELSGLTRVCVGPVVLETATTGIALDILGMGIIDDGRVGITFLIRFDEQQLLGALMEKHLRGMISKLEGVIGGPENQDSDA